MSYFGVISCSGCGQKVSLSPDQVLVDRETYGYFCRRCRKAGDIPEGFEFKHPTKKNLGVMEAIRVTQKSNTGWFSQVKDFLFSKGL